MMHAESAGNQIDYEGSSSRRSLPPPRPRLIADAKLRQWGADLRASVVKASHRLQTSRDKASWSREVAHVTLELPGLVGQGDQGAFHREYMETLNAPETRKAHETNIEKVVRLEAEQDRQVE